MHITEIAVKRPVTITVLCLAVIMLGMYSFHKLSIDFLPEIDIPKLIVKVECPGANARDVEENVTQIIEATISTLHNVRKINSISREGIAFIHIEFNWGSDMDMAFIKVRSKLDRMQESLPEFAERPNLLRFDPSSTPIMTFVVTGERIENPRSPKDYKEALVELKEVASSIVKRRLEQIDGIAYTLVSGGLEREIKILLNYKKCLAFNIGFDEIESALRRFNVSTSGGTIREGYFQYPLRIIAEYSNVKEIYDTPIKRTETDHIIFLRDIARIEDGYIERSGYTKLNGKEVITLFLFKEAGANTVEASRKVYNTLYRLYLEYPEFKVMPVFDQAEFIQEAIDNVLQSLFLGGIFAFFILFYFLKDLKSPIIIGISIPISIITTLIFMYFFDINFNIISLGGLALGIGLLVDNSIVVLENIYRYKEKGLSLVQATITGTKEVSLAITASTFTTISVFLPLIYIKGLAGELFYDQSITITISLTVSLIVSITLLSMLASKSHYPFEKLIYRWNMKEFQLISLELRNRGIIKKLVLLIIGVIENILYTISYLLYRIIIRYLLQLLNISIQYFQRGFQVFINFYELNLERALRNRGKVLVVILFLVCLCGVLSIFIKKELMPPVDRKQLVICAELAPGSSLTATTSIITKLEKTLLKQPGIKSVLSSIGITENILNQSYQPAVNKAILDIETKENANTFTVMRNLERLSQNYKGLNIQVSRRESIFEQLFQQQPDQFDIKISGPEMEELSKINQQLTEFMNKEESYENVISSLKPGGQEYSLKLNRDKTIQYNITLAEIAQFLKRQIQGSVPTKFIDFSDKIDIKVSNASQSEITLRKIKRLNFPVLASEKKIYIPMNQLVTITPEQGYSEITRNDQSRNILITASLNGISFKNAIEKIENYLQQLQLPGGYLVQIGSKKKEMQEQFENLLLILVISLALVYFILSAQFESIKIPLIIIMAIPLSLIGIIFTLFITGNTINIMSFIGTVILVGIVVNDSIVKVDFIHRKHLSGSSVKTAIKEAGQKRFRPIMMTTVTTICGLLPMALSLGTGSELRRPLAWVVIGGIFMATMLTLIVIPVIYSIVVKDR
jgi:hydrophobic/amphiphilic exporter-1 (mainly G- bacteria), HAE1 family